MQTKFFQKTVNVFLVVVLLTGFFLTVAPVKSAFAATITVDGITCVLSDAITAANTNIATGGCVAGSGADTIDLQTDVLLAATLPTITSEIIIAGNGHTVDGAGTYQILHILALPPFLLGDLTIQQLTVTNGFSSGNDGGGILNEFGLLAVISSTISENSAGLGGGIYNNGGTLIVTNSTFSGNSATAAGGFGDGGGINNTGPMVLTNVNFTNNQAADTGGGIFNASDNSMLESVSFSGNQAVFGGGYFNQTNSDTEFTNVEVLGNQASENGAGIYNSGAITMTNSTLSGNQALGSGGGVYNSSSEALFQNTVIWNNQDISGTQIARASIFNASGTPNVRYSDFEGCGGSEAWDIACGTDGGNNIDADPVFVTPVDLSSLPTTNGDLRLSANSAVTNIADDAVCPSHGLGGNQRPLGPGCDQGAYEYYGPGLIKTVGLPEVELGQTFTYTIHIFNATTEALTGGVVSDTLPAGLNFVGPISLDPGSAGDVGDAASFPELVTNLTLGIGEEVTVTLPVSVSYGIGGAIINTAWLTLSEAPGPYSDTVAISVTNVAPVAVDDSGSGYLTYPNNPFTTGNVLENDLDANDDMLSVASYDTGVLSGTLTSNGDGTFEYNPNSMFDDLAEGDQAYDVFTYVVSDGILTDTGIVTITVSNSMIPIVDAGLDQAVDEGALVEFDGSFEDPAFRNTPMAEESYHWDFGDGYAITGTLTPTHTYADNGSYTVTLTVTNTYGSAGSDSLLVTVENVAPVLSALPDQDTEVGEVITVTGTITDPGVLDNQTVLITWADGVTTTLNLEATERQFEATHIYTVAGHYTVDVEVMDKDDDTDEKSFLVRVFMELLFPLIFGP